jgi:HNH endonuclease.
MRLSSLKPKVQSAIQSRVTQGDNWREGKNGSTARLYDYRWQKARAEFLAEHPLCQCPNCNEGKIRLTVATVVDHHIPHRGNVTLFWDRSNWRAMANACHDLKTRGGG